jgi:hypothetical protein
MPVEGMAGSSAHPARAGDPGDGFDDRYVQVSTTFGGAGVVRGDLTAECAAASSARHMELPCLHNRSISCIIML